MQMRQNDWIVPAGRDERQRLLWQLTPKALKLLETQQPEPQSTTQIKTN